MTIEIQKRRLSVTAILPSGGKTYLVKHRHVIQEQDQESTPHIGQLNLWALYAPAPSLGVSWVICSFKSHCPDGWIPGPARLMKAKIRPKVSSPEEPWANCSASLKPAKRAIRGGG